MVARNWNWKPLLLSCILFCAYCITITEGNCHFDEIPAQETEHHIYSIPETTAPNSVLWQSVTQNILQAAALPSPHLPYIRGLRYSSRYEYQAGDNFSHFIDTERLDLIRRDVRFSCADQSTRDVTFYFHILDQNTSPPTFDTETGEYRFTFSYSSQTDLVGSLKVTDMDFSLENAYVQVTSSQSIFPVEKRSLPGTDNGYVYQVDLKVDKERLHLGEYNFRVIAHDGKHIESVSVVVVVEP